MAIVEFKKKNKNETNQYCNSNALKFVICYILREDKIPSRVTGAIGASSINAKTAIQQFQKVKEAYRNTKGKKVIHFWVSFEQDEKRTLEEYRHIGYRITEYFGGEYQIVFALHEDTENDHLHFVVNTVNFTDGKKLRWQRGDKLKLEKYVDNIINPDK